jgi:hypothetical protein
MASIVLEDGKASPPPVDLVVLDQAIPIEFDDFNEIHSLSFRNRERIFEDQSVLPVAQISGPVVLAHGWLPLDHLAEESAL